MGCSCCGARCDASPRNLHHLVPDVPCQTSPGWPTSPWPAIRISTRKFHALPWKEYTQLCKLWEERITTQPYHASQPFKRKQPPYILVMVYSWHNFIGLQSISKFSYSVYLKFCLASYVLRLMNHMLRWLSTFRGNEGKGTWYWYHSGNLTYPIKSHFLKMIFLFPRSDTSVFWSQSPPPSMDPHDLALGPLLLAGLATGHGGLHFGLFGLLHLNVDASEIRLTTWDVAKTL